MSSFSETLRNLRKQQKEKQDTVGKAIGKSRETITKYENKLAEPDIETLVNIARHFGVSVDFLTGSLDSNNIIAVHPNIKKYEKYLQNGNFEDFLKIASKIFDNEIDISDINSMVDNLINIKEKYTRKKHP
ncbi:MAG: helix-turn-helix domain-containing protein [Clostridia bacterium]|nr:helix-turn-helix domain-containing protein [Clostridia bacterium]